VPHHPTRGLGCRKFHGSCGPGRKWILCIFEVRKKPPGTPFSVFLSVGGAPKRRGARENFPPFPFSRRACIRWYNGVKTLVILRFADGVSQNNAGAAVGLLYMLLKHYIDRYNIYFAYRPSKINRRIHMTAINFVIVSLFILQLMLLVFIVLRAGAELPSISPCVASQETAINQSLYTTTSSAKVTSK